VPHFQQGLLNRLTWVTIGWFVFTDMLARAEEPIRWRVGGAFTQQLQDPVDNIDWHDRTLREGLVRLSQTFGVATFVDRRIDPDQLITASAKEQSLHSWLRTVATLANADISMIGPVVYFGPPETARNVATLAALRRQDATRLANSVKARILRSGVWQSPALAQPRELLNELGRQAGVTFANAEALPLDVWPAITLPPLPWVDRVTLLLVGFGMTFELNEQGTAARLVPVPTTLILEKRYSPRGGAAELVAQLRKALPDAKIRSEQNQLLVAARQEDHEKIERLLTGQSVSTGKTTKATGEKVYSLKVPNQPAGRVVQKIADSIGKQPQFTPTVAEKLKQPIELEVKDVTLSYLLEKALKPLGLGFRLGEDVLEIFEEERR